MAAILKFRRGSGVPTLTESEPYFNENLGIYTLNIGTDGGGGWITLANMYSVNEGDFRISSNLYAVNADFTGNVDLDGDLFVGGDITLGAGGNDTIFVGAPLSGSLIPTVSSTYDIGSVLKPWKHIYADSATIGSVLASSVDYSNVLNKPTLVSGSSQISHDSTSGYTVDRHIDHSTLSITAGNGLTGGGILTSTRTLNIDGTGIYFVTSVTDILDDLGVVSGSGGYNDADNLSYMNSLGVVSGSSQISFNGITDRPTLVSGSSQIEFTEITNVPTTIVSGSDQVSGSFLNLTAGTSNIVTGEINSNVNGSAINFTSNNGYIQGLSRVYGSANGSQSWLFGTNDNRTYVPIYANTSDTIDIGTSTTYRFRDIYAKSINLTGEVSSSSFIKDGGLGTEFLMADGTVDGTTYLESGSYIPTAGGSLTGNLIVDANALLRYRSISTQYINLYNGANANMEFHTAHPSDALNVFRFRTLGEVERFKIDTTGTETVGTSTALSFITTTGSADDILLADGSTTSLSGLGIGDLPSGVVSGSDQISGSFVNLDGDTMIGDLNVDSKLYVGTGSPPFSGIYDFSVQSSDLGAVFMTDLPVSAGSGRAFAIGSTGQSFSTLIMYANGTMGVGSGNATRDSFFGWGSTNTFKIGSNYDLTGTGHLEVTGNVTASAYIKSGSSGDDILLGDGTTTSLAALGGSELPSGVVSGSSQVDHDLTTNYLSGEHFLQTEIAISSSQLTDTSNIAYLDTNQTFTGVNRFSSTAGFGDGIVASIDTGYAMHIRDSSANLLKIERTTTANAVMSFANTVKTWYFGSSNSTGDYVIGESLDLTNNRVFSIDTTTKNVGIGIVGGGTNADERLSVVGNVSASAYIKSGGTSDDILLGDGTTTSLAGLDSSLPSGVVSGSSQIDHDSTTNFDQLEHFTSGSIILTSGQVTDALTFTPYNSTNPSGYTTNVGTVTSVGTTAPLSGTVTTTGNLSITQATTSTDGYLSSTDWNTFNNKTTNTGTVTSVGTNTGLSGTVTTTGNLSLDLPSLALGGTLVGTDWLIASNGGVQNRQVISSIPLSIFNNNSGWTSNTGTVTSVTGGTGTTSSGGTTPSISLNFAELTDMTANIAGTTEFILQNGSTESRKAASEIQLSFFNNNSGWTSNSGTVTSVGNGNGMNFTTITGAGTVTLGTPGSLTASTTNGVTTSSHTHAITGFLKDVTDTLTGTLSVSTGVVPVTDNTGVVGTAALTWNNGQFTSLTVDSTLNVRGAIDLADNDNLRFGSSDDFILDFNATNFIINQNVAGNILITSAADATTITMNPGTGDITTAGNVLPDTDNTGVVGQAANTWNNGNFTNFTVNSTLTASGTINCRGAIDLADNDILRFGTGDDVEMAFDGTNFNLDLNLGEDLRIRDGNSANATRFTFDSDLGNLTATGDMTAVDFNLSSDKRLKTKIKSLNEYQITTNWSKWNWKKDGSHDIGLIAQDLEKTNPEFVKTDKEGFKSVAYTKVLVAKMIEKDIQIEELKEENEDLKHRMDRLEFILNNTL